VLPFIAWTAAAISAQPAPEIVSGPGGVSLRRAIENELRSNNHQFGPFRASPLFELRNFGYDSNIFGSPDEEVSDVTGVVAAGGRGIAPLGRKHYFRGDAAAEYFWFAQEEDRRNWGWNVGGSFLGLYNRASFEAAARSTDRYEPVSAELDALYNRRTTIGLLSGEIEITPRLSLIGRLEADRYRHESDEATEALRRLDRTDNTALVGVSYDIGRNVTVGLQTASYDSDFVETPDREGFVHLASLRFEGNRLFINSAVGQRNLDVDEPLAEGYDDFTGSYYAALRSIRGAALEVWGRRGLEYSVVEDAFYYLDIRNGLAGSARMGRRARVRAFAEVGKNEYPPADGSRGERVDDVISYGAGIWFRVYRSSVLGLQITTSDYQSNFPEFDRSVERLILSFSLRGDPF
jgi:hypothetical protein